MTSRLNKHTMVAIAGLLLGSLGQGAVWAQAGGGGGGAAAGGAGGAGEAGAYNKDNWPSEAVKRPLTLGRGMIQIDADTFYASLSNNAVFKPFGFRPDIEYGVTDILQVRLYHPVRGLCLAGDTNGCPKVYNDVGVEGAYNLMPVGPFNIAAQAALEVLAFSPDSFMGIRVGLLGHYLAAGQINLVFDPSLYFGITNRDLGNKEILTIPVTLQFQATPQLMVFVDAALSGIIDPPVGGFGDTDTGSLGIGALFNINKMLDVGAEFRFDRLFGNLNSGDFRTLFLRANIRL
jgi:hypothetical protein